LGKLAFWKKDDSLDSFERSLGSDPGLRGESNFDRENGFGRDNGLRQNDHFGLPNDDLHSDASSPVTATDYFRSTRQPSMQPISQQQSPLQDASNHRVEKDLEVISSKLDAMKSQLELLNQRMIRIEHIADSQEKQEKDVLRW